VEWLADRFRNYLHLPDPAVLYALMGAVAANMLEGQPVWLMLIGAPGSGKTELLNTLGGLEHLYPVDSVDGPAPFLSGTGKKEKSRDATGGILNQIGLHGGIVIKDFTGILSLEPGKAKLVLDCLRQVYDGRWTRPVGTDGGKVLQWPAAEYGGKRGHVALFAGVTGRIDHHHTVNASLGERWLYFRMTQNYGRDKAAVAQRRVTQEALARQAMANNSRAGWREELRDIVTAFVMSQDMEFGRKQKRRDLTNNEVLRITRMAAVSAMCRSAVSRDYVKHDVDGWAETEELGRVTTQMNQLYAGMEYIGVSEGDRWRVLARIALDSVPLIRRLIVRLVVTSGDPAGIGYRELSEKVGVSESVMIRAVEDLELHGAVTVNRSESRGQTKVRLSEFMLREWEWKEWGS
jgi:energy-coupling factor transporter ATP-binding protein EcfA2